MKKDIKYLIIILAFAAFGLSCEKDITVELPDTVNKIVVEGFIENGSPAQVKISKNSPYFSEVNAETISNLSIGDAKVTVSDGVNSEVLTVKDNLFGFPKYIYVGSKLKGVVGKTYTLTIETMGQTITAETTIPEPVKKDSIWFEPNSVTDSLYGLIHYKFTDPAGQKNYYRTFYQVSGKDMEYTLVNRGFFNDEYIAGNAFEFQIRKQRLTQQTPSGPPGSGANQNKEIYFKKGEFVYIKMCSIDEKSYKFYLSASMQASSGNNPFSNPSNVKSYIKGALGVWTGQSAYVYTYLVK